MIFIQLEPEQACDRWPLVRQALSESVPPNIRIKEDFYTKNLDDVSLGRKVVWLGVEKSKEVMLAITTITDDIDSNNRNVTVYSLYGIIEDDIAVGQMLREGVSTLLKYAVANNCNKICAYTAFPKIVELAKKLGFDTQWTFISMEVPDELKTKSSMGEV